MAATHERPTPWALFVAALSVLVLVAVGLPLVPGLDPGTRRIVEWMDVGFCLVFLADFAIQVATARDRGRYLRTWGWLDLVSSLPLQWLVPGGELARLGRAARLVRIVRLLRLVRSVRVLFHVVWGRRGQSVVLAALFLALILLSAGSITILQLEQHLPAAKIRTPEDALWWAFVTMTTTGYGDLVPVTGPGRVLAGALMASGIALFATFSGLFASWFLGGRFTHEEEQLVRLREELARLHHENARLRALESSRMGRS